MSRGQSLQDPYLNVLRKERVPVSIYLVNGIKLQGQIDSFDQFVFNTFDFHIPSISLYLLYRRLLLLIALCIC